MGVILMRDGRNAEAIAKFEAALTLDPLFLEAHLNIGKALDNVGEDARALSHYEEILRHDPMFYKAYINIGKIQRKTGNLDAAVHAYRRGARDRAGKPPRRISIWAMP